jgi:hypothetical protein
MIRKNVFFTDEDRAEIKRLREKLKHIEVSKPELAETYAGACGEQCMVTCAHYCESNCNLSCATSCRESCTSGCTDSCTGMVYLYFSDKWPGPVYIQ